MLLHDLLKCAKLLGVSEPEFSENMTMKEMNQELRKHILEDRGRSLKSADVHGDSRR